MSEITVSDCSDAALFSALHCACFEQGWTSSMMTGVLALPHASFLVAYCADKPVGMMIFTCVAGEAEIITVCVLPDFRRKGVAAALLGAAFARAKIQRAESFFLEVSVENKPAAALYAKFGFEQIGVRKNYYHTAKGRADALTMRAVVA